MTDVIQADPEQLRALASGFEKQQSEVSTYEQQLARARQPLSGRWLGATAEAFLAELDGRVMPSLRRLEDALGEAGRTLQQVDGQFSAAEQEAASPFSPSGSDAAGGTGGGSGGGSGGGQAVGGSSTATDSAQPGSVRFQSSPNNGFSVSGDDVGARGTPTYTEGDASGAAPNAGAAEADVVKPTVAAGASAVAGVVAGAVRSRRQRAQS